MKHYEAYYDMLESNDGNMVRSLSSISINTDESDLSSSMGVNNIYEIFENPPQQFTNY